MTIEARDFPWFEVQKRALESQVYPVWQKLMSMSEDIFNLDSDGVVISRNRKAMGIKLDNLQFGKESVVEQFLNYLTINPDDPNYSQHIVRLVQYSQAQYKYRLEIFRSDTASRATEIFFGLPPSDPFASRFLLCSTDSFLDKLNDKFVTKIRLDLAFFLIQSLKSSLELGAKTLSQEELGEF